LFALRAIEKYSGTAKDKFDIEQFFICIKHFFEVFLGSFGIGSSMGCVTALMTKYTYIRQHSGLETALFILMSYSTFLAAEACNLTGKLMNFDLL
jgi:sodium/hydrogen exchanger-like protein 6/7